MSRIYSIIIIILFSCQVKTYSAEPANFTGEIVYSGELWQVARGGIESGTRYLHNIDLIFSGPLDAYGLEGGSFSLYGLTTNRGELSADLVGDLQVVSNIDNGEVFRLQEAWYQHEFTHFRAKIGLIDLNSEFDVIEAAGLFLNSSHGIGPDFSQTGEGGPSIFPSTSPAFLVEFTGLERWQLMVGIFDAVPNDPDNPKRQKISLNEGALLVGEIHHTLTSGLRLGLGFYSYTSQFTPLLAPTQSAHGNKGAYATIEAPLSESLDGWLRYGIANGRFNPLKGYLGAGLVLSGPWAGRRDDQLGIAFGWGRTGNDFQQTLRADGQRPAGGELNIELTYHYQINDMVSLQPDIQYVTTPGGSHRLKDALVIGIRFQVGHKF